MARQRLGQHFLIRGSILNRIAAAACPTRQSLVIEIGPGKGALTERLLPRAERVVAIEVDPLLVRHLHAKFGSNPSLELIEADVLHTDLAQWGAAAIAGNLPYYIATPIIEKVLKLGPALTRGVFLLQKEVADRLTAAPGSRDYGYFSVAVALYSDAEILFTVGPAAFHPPPKVDSAVLRLVPRNRSAELGLTDSEAFLRFVSQCFRQKRKTIRNNLAGHFKRAGVDALPEAGLRAEQISLETFAQIYRRLVG